jgi:hypothetical protein
MAEQSRPDIHIKGVFCLKWQINPQLPRLSRDGGASVLLNGHLIWLFDDTEVTPGVVDCSNTTVYSHAPERNITLLRNFGIFTSGKLRTAQERAVIAYQTLSDGGWMRAAYCDM